MGIQFAQLCWTPLRRLFGICADKPSVRLLQTRSLLFQLVESEICAADALLDLGDREGCDHHLSAAVLHAQALKGPESMLMHDRLNELSTKRNSYPYPTAGE